MARADQQIADLKRERDAAREALREILRLCYEEPYSEVRVTTVARAALREPIPPKEISDGERDDWCTNDPQGLGSAAARTQERPPRPEAHGGPMTNHLTRAEGGAVEAAREALHPMCRIENCRIEKLLDTYAAAVGQAAQEEAEAKVARLQEALDTTTAYAARLAKGLDGIARDTEAPCYQPYKNHADELAADPKRRDIIGIRLEERDCGECYACLRRPPQDPAEIVESTQPKG
jgi:hypothetical protein